MMPSLVSTKERRRRKGRMRHGTFAEAREKACDVRKGTGSESVSKANGAPRLRLFDNTKEEEEKALTVIRRTGMREEKPEAKQ